MLAAVVRAVVAQLAAEVAHDPGEQHVAPLPQPLPVLLGLGCGTSLGLGRLRCRLVEGVVARLRWRLFEGVAARLRGWGGGGGAPAWWRRRGSEHTVERLGHGGEQLRRIGGGVPALLVV